MRYPLKLVASRMITTLSVIIRCRLNRRNNQNEKSDFNNKSWNDSDFQRRWSFNSSYCITGPCVVTQVKTEENDGYSAVQVGFVDKKEKGINKPQKGHFDKAGVAPKRFVREFRFENAEEYTVGQEIKADIFAAGDKIDATATSKGKGYAGGIKRHGLKSGPSAHGSKYHRHAGSNGMASDPSKVFKGKKMPGQMGAERVTIQNLEIVKVDADQNIILVKGAVPGPKKSLVMLKESVKA